MAHALCGNKFSGILQLSYQIVKMVCETLLCLSPFYNKEVTFHLTPSSRAKSTSESTLLDSQ
jgi:hypothetical protein